jgi:preprotein translocase subunit YajC
MKGCLTRDPVTPLTPPAVLLQSAGGAHRLLSRGSSAVFISNAYAQGAAPAAGGGDFSLFILIPLMVIVFFMMIRPQMKRQKEQKAMLEALVKGDEVVTAGGVLGRISKIGDTYLHLDTGNGVELQVQRSAIVQVLPKGTLK